MMNVGELIRPRTPRPAPMPWVSVVLPAPRSPVSTTRSPARRNAAKCRPNAVVRALVGQSTCSCQCGRSVAEVRAGITVQSRRRRRCARMLRWAAGAQMLRWVAGLRCRGRAGCSGVAVGAREPRGDPGDDLVVDRARRLGPILRCGLPLGARPEQYGPLAHLRYGSVGAQVDGELVHAHPSGDTCGATGELHRGGVGGVPGDRKSTRLN